MIGFPQEMIGNSIAPITGWEQVAPQLSAQPIIECMVELGSDVYGCTSGGYLFKWNGTDAWTQAAPPLTGTSLTALVVYGGEIYGGRNSNGDLWKWDGVSAWTLAATGPSFTLEDMIVSGGFIYAAMSGRLYTSTGGAWTSVAALFASSGVTALADLGGSIYGGTGNGGTTGRLYLFTGSAWSLAASAYAVGTTVQGMLAFGGVLYGALSTGDLVYFTGSAWALAAPVLSASAPTRGHVLAEYVGSLYMGTTNGQLLEWDGVSAFTSVAPQINSQQIFCILAAGDEIFGGTSAGGRLQRTTH